MESERYLSPLSEGYTPGEGGIFLLPIKFDMVELL